MSDFSHASGLPATYDRHGVKGFDRLLFAEKAFAQGAEWNELQSIIEARGQRTGNLVARDGDRVSGADVIIDARAETATLTAGEIYIGGDVRPVQAAVLNGLTMIGEVRVGVRLVITTITSEQDPDLLGLEPGTLAELEPGAARQRETIRWGYDGDGGSGFLYPVYLIKDATVIDQSPPPSLTGINRAIGRYDFGANGSYIVRGCRVTALGRSDNNQVFVISEGEFNVRGAKYERETALRHEEPEAFDVEQVDAEPHIFADGGSGRVEIRVNRGPIDQVQTVTITRQKTETIVRGGASATSDALSEASVVAISSVVQRRKAFSNRDDYQRSGANIDWSPDGQEPQSGSSYAVTYTYLENVAPDSQTSDTVTVSGGVQNSNLFITYTWKLSRIDLLCLNEDGRSVYIKGLPTRATPLPPLVTADVLPVAVVTNNWVTRPAIKGTNQRSIPFEEQWRWNYRIVDLLDLVLIELLRHDIDLIEDVAKYATFGDDFQNDLKRDAGEAQTLAVVAGSLQLAVDPVIFPPLLSEALMLPYVEEVIIAQELVTACTLINPYQNFTPLPASMTIDPPTDFWVEREVQWTSGATVQFAGQNAGRRPAGTQLVDERAELLDFLRRIDIDFEIKGFGAGEKLDRLLFDSVNVTPAGPLAADDTGTVAGTFAIPANSPAGRKLVEATGTGGSAASAVFEGQGRLEIDLVRELPEPPPSTRPSRDSRRRRGGNTVKGEIDPAGQTFITEHGRMLTSIEARFCARGADDNDIVVDLREVTDDSRPARQAFASQRINMATVVLDAWHNIEFGIPRYRGPGIEQAMVFMTDDAEHGLSMAVQGGFDEALQIKVAAQPYTVGVRVDSSNNRAWTVHQDSDLTFRVKAARFTRQVQTFDLGKIKLVNVSDIQIRAGLELPTADCSVIFEIVRADKSVIRLLESQNHEFDEFITEQVTVRAVLAGTELVSPILHPNVLVVAGRLQTTGDYITRADDYGQNVDLMARMRNRLPDGSTMSVLWDNGHGGDGGHGGFAALNLDTSTLLNDGWTQRDYSVAGITAQTGRLKIHMTGTPASRPAATRLRVYSKPGR